jgi:subtilisin family serine protease
MTTGRSPRSRTTPRTFFYFGILLFSALVFTSLIMTSAEAESAALKVSSETLTAEEKLTTNMLSEIENEVVVVMEKSISMENARSIAKSLDGQLVGEPTPDGLENIKTIRFEGANGNEDFIESKVKELAETPGVISAEPNAFVEMHYRPNDTFFSKPRGTANQGNLSLIGMPAAWSKSKGNGAGIGIADSGLPPSSYGEFPASKVLAQVDVLNNDSVAEDNAGHGSAVSAIAAARTENGFGMAGAGFNAKVAMCKFSTRYPNGVIGGSVAGLGRCIDWLQKRPNVAVLNLSLSLAEGETSSLISREIQETQQQYGKVVVAAVGNEGKYTTTQLPASLPGVIGVGSIDNRYSRSRFSNYGPAVDIMAPGNNIVAYVVQGEKPALESGTSFAAPQIAGCAALLSAKGYNAGQIRNRLLKNATDMGPAGRDDRTGHGYLNCGKAFN